MKSMIIMTYYDENYFITIYIIIILYTYIILMYNNKCI